MPNPHNRLDPGEMIARQVEAKGVTDPRVLDAIRQVPRNRFVPPIYRLLALMDRPLAIGFEQTISQPFMVAAMTWELDVHAHHRVLEIGTGSGYQSAILAQLAAEVWTVERFDVLSLRARSILDGLRLTNLRYRIGDGSLGWPEFAPFDRIMVTAAAPALPSSLFHQLIEGGVLVAPIGPDDEQQLTVVRKQDGQPLIREVFPCRFVKLVGQEGWSLDS